MLEIPLVGDRTAVSDYHMNGKTWPAKGKMIKVEERADCFSDRM